MKDLFISRKFWAALIGLALIVVGVFAPDYQIDQEAAIGFVIIIASYIVGVAVDPGPGGWRGVIKSRKFWAAVVGLAALLVSSFGRVLPLSPENMIEIAVLIGGYIASVAVESLTKIQA